MPGIYHSYKSDYPNQVHQLNFSISQNHYLLKNGEIKYQQKKFDVNWSNYSKSGKRHLVNYLVRDHFSNCFYAELHPIDELPTISDFLYNAWRPKEEYEFSGIPTVLIVGRNVIERFPEIQQLHSKRILLLQLATNGFATGVRSLRDWEHNIRFYSFYENCKTISGFQRNTEIICREINLHRTGKTEVNLTKWLSNNPRGADVPDKADFEKYFMQVI